MSYPIFQQNQSRASQFYRLVDRRGSLLQWSVPSNHHYHSCTFALYFCLSSVPHNQSYRQPCFLNCTWTSGIRCGAADQCSATFCSPPKRKPFGMAVCFLAQGRLWLITCSNKGRRHRHRHSHTVHI